MFYVAIYLVSWRFAMEFEVTANLGAPHSTVARISDYKHEPLASRLTIIPVSLSIDNWLSVKYARDGIKPSTPCTETRTARGPSRTAPQASASNTVNMN